MDLFNDWFWNEKIWLPKNYTWKDMEPTAEKQFTQFSHLGYPIIVGILLIPVRSFTEKFFIQNIGIKLGLPRPVSSTSLRHPVRPPKLKKFTESGWRFLCSTILWIYGQTILYHKSWFWDTRDCWIDYPNHSIDGDIWWYFMMSASFYWSLFFSQFSDIQRKDFWQMCLHHMLTIVLLGISWVCNMTRMGSLIIVVHDPADVFLEITKMSKYAGWHKVCDFLFGIFTISWLFTRLYIYPTYILRSTLFESKSILEIFPVYYIVNTMLLTLLLLHIFWTYFVLRVLKNAMTNRKFQDSRSSSEEDVDEDEKDKKSQ